MRAVIGEARAGTTYESMAMSIIFGTNAGDTITGTDSSDTIDALGGNDAVDGLGGDDIIIGGSGDDTISGGAGSDKITGGSGNDLITGGIVGDHGFDVLDGGDGDDTLVLTAPGVAHGGDGFDVLRFYADGNNAAVIGISSIADAHAFVGTDGTIVDGVEELVFQGGSGNDWVRGGDNPDTLYVNGGSNVVDAQGGDDSIAVRAEATNTILGGSGYDTLYLEHDATDRYVFAASGNLATDSFHSQFVDIESFHIFGGDGVEIVSLGKGDDTFSGGGGDDLARGGNGADLLSGGTGNDTLFGNNGDDKLYGGAGNDVIFGGAGNDILRGDAGDDALDGGAGSDRYNGGAGADRFFISGNDMVGDFHTGEDRLEFQASDFGLNIGALSSENFAYDTAVGDQGQFVYHTDTGKLFWDANGMEAGGATEVASLAFHPVLTFSDFDLY